MTLEYFFDHAPGLLAACTSLVGAIGTVWLGWRSIGSRRLTQEGVEVSKQGVEVSKENSTALNSVAVSVNGRVEQLLAERDARARAERDARDAAHEAKYAATIAELEARYKTMLAEERARSSDPVVVARRARSLKNAATRASAALATSKAYSGPEHRKINKGPPRGMKDRRKP